KDLEAEVRVGFDVLARTPAACPQQQIFLDGLAREKAAALRHQRDTKIYNLFCRHADQVMALPVDLGADGALARTHDAHDALHESTFSVAIRAEQHHGFA